MPRARATTEEEKVEKKTTRTKAAPKKTPAKKTPAKKAAPKKTAARKTTKKTEAKKPVRKTTAKKKTPAKKAVKKSVDEVEGVLETSVEVSEMSATTKKRKAPTVFASDAAKKRAIKTQAVVVCVLLVMGVGASAAVGFNDSEAGKINVEETIRKQNALMANMVDVDGPTVVAPTPSGAAVPESSFIASADQSTRKTVQPEASTASSTATSTESVATSTVDGVTENQLNAEDVDIDLGEASAIDTATTTVTAVDQIEPEEVPETDDSIKQIE